MDIRAEDIQGIPHGNLRVQRAVFIAVWREAERAERSDQYAVGVAWTCRWKGWAIPRSM